MSAPAQTLDASGTVVMRRAFTAKVDEILAQAEKRGFPGTAQVTELYPTEQERHMLAMFERCFNNGLSMDAAVAMFGAVASPNLADAFSVLIELAGSEIDREFFELGLAIARGEV